MQNVTAHPTRTLYVVVVVNCPAMLTAQPAETCLFTRVQSQPTWHVRFNQSSQVHGLVRDDFQSFQHLWSSKLQT